MVSSTLLMMVTVGVAYVLVSTSFRRRNPMLDIFILALVFGCAQFSGFIDITEFSDNFFNVTYGNVNFDNSLNVTTEPNIPYYDEALDTNCTEGGTDCVTGTVSKIEVNNSEIDDVYSDVFNTGDLLDFDI